MQEFDYREYLENVGIEKGDILDVASDLLSILVYCRKYKLKFDANRLLDVLQEMVGEDGTIMIRAFSWDFCKGKTFDMQNTPSQVGSLGNIAMKRGDFQRTQHPIYSWLVWGKYQQELCLLENVASFGKGTPFDFLYHHQGKQLSIGNMESLAITHIHHAEKMGEVWYRTEKVFKADYIGKDGQKEEREYTMYVRPLNVDVHSDEKELYIEFGEKGIKIAKLYQGELNCEILKIREAVDSFLQDIKENDCKKFIAINGKKGISHFKDKDSFDFGIVREECN